MAKDLVKQKKIRGNSKKSHKIVKRLVLQFYDYYIKLKITKKRQFSDFTTFYNIDAWLTFGEKAKANVV